MKALNVQMYVRTKEGYIAKLLHYGYNEGISGKSHLFDSQIRDISDLVYENDNFLWDKELKEYVKNYSYDILDLIEVGDYVNGKKVYSLGLTIGILNTINFEDGTFTIAEDIKSIVTKEQFENMEYKI
jgi:hypothetical protein